MAALRYRCLPTSGTIALPGQAVRSGLQGLNRHLVTLAARAIAMNLQGSWHQHETARRLTPSANDESPRFRRPIGDSYQSLIGVYCRFIVDNPAGAWRFIVPSLVLHWRFIVTALQFHRGQFRRPEFPAAPGKSGLAG